MTFGSLEGNSDLFVQVIAHKAAAACSQHSVTIFKSWTDHTTCQTHRRSQTTPYDVISPQTCAEISDGSKERISGQVRGPLQYGVGRPDGANTMIKTFQHLAEADNSRVLVALDLKAAFQNVSRRAMLYSIAQTDAESRCGLFQVVHWHHGAPNALRLSLHQNHCQQWIRVVLCQRVDSQQLLTQYSVQSWRSFARITTQAPNSLPTWTTGTCGSNRSASCRQLLSSQQPPDRSILLYSPPKHRCGKALVKTPLHPSSKTRSRSHFVVWEDTYKSMETLSPALLEATMEKTTQCFQKIATTLADLNAEGLNVQTLNDLLTMYVGAASQHVLRMSFVPEQETRNFDRQVITYWSRLMHRDIASPLFFLPSSLVDLG